MHSKAMEARFPEFHDVFTYDIEGSIVKVNRWFTWHGFDYRVLVNYILNLVRGCEQKNMERLTNIDKFVDRTEELMNYV